MTLYLSSYRFGENPERLRNLCAGSGRTVVIANALDFSNDLTRTKARIAAEIATLRELGFTASQLDLRRFFDNPDRLQDSLEQQT